MARVLVTGATGFIGAALTRLLIADGHEVAVLIGASSNSWRLGDIVHDIRKIVGVIQAPESYRDAVRAFSPESVFHLAWTGASKLSRDDPDQIHINVCGTVSLFRTVAEAGCNMFVGAGSQAEYGPHATCIDETSLTAPASVYGAAKLAAYALLAQQAVAFKVPFAWLRLFSVYGPQDGANTLVASLIRDLLAKRRPSVTSAEQMWDFLYVDDAARAFQAVAASRATGLFNVASGESRPLREMITTIRDAIDPTAAIGFGEVSRPPGAIVSLQPRIDRLLRATQWRPTTSFLNGIAATVTWHNLRQSSTPDAIIAR